MLLSLGLMIITCMFIDRFMTKTNPGVAHTKVSDAHNTNGLISQFILKGTDFLKVSHDDIEFVENRLNHRPMKCIEFDRPILFLKNHCCT